MKDFKYISHGKISNDSGKTVGSTVYKQRFKGIRRFNIPRILYSLLLIYFAYIILFYVGNKLFFVTGKGVVLSDKFVMLAQEDINILSFSIGEGEKILEGDTLFRYYSEKQYVNQKQTQASLLSYTESHNKESLALIKNIGLKKIKRTYYWRLYNNKKKLISKLGKEVFLNVSERNYLESSREKLLEIRADISFISNEISYLEKHLTRLNKKFIRNRHSYNKSLLSMNSINYMQSPIEGVVTKHIRSGDICDKGEWIMEIAKDKGIIILANIPEKQMSSIKGGDSVVVVFSDGVKSMGTVQQVIEPVEEDSHIEARELDKITKILVKIIPNEGEIDKWEKRKGLTVEIRKFKLWF